MIYKWDIWKYQKCQSLSFEKANKNYKLLVRLRNEKKAQVTSITNEMEPLLQSLTLQSIIEVFIACSLSHDFLWSYEL